LLVINEKLGRNLSLWQSDVNISSTLQADAMDQIFSQIEDTKTNALVYLTVYPILGFGNVSDAAIAQFASKIKDLTSKGTKLYIRYASEMNGIFLRIQLLLIFFFRRLVCLWATTNCIQRFLD
jgi:hypothetical protein